MTWGQLLGALLLKPTCVLASGLAITVLARRAPAATRHAVWTAAVSYYSRYPSSSPSCHASS